MLVEIRINNLGEQSIRYSKGRLNYVVDNQGNSVFLYLYQLVL